MATDPWAAFNPQQPTAPGLPGRPIIRKGLDPVKPDLPEGFSTQPGIQAFPIEGLPPPKPDKGDRGTLPKGWEVGPDNVARPIAGLPSSLIEGSGKDAKADVALSQINDIESIYTKSLKGQPASRGFGMAEYLPTPDMKLFDDASMQMLPLIRPLIAQTAREGDSNKEMEVFLSFVPSRWDSDGSIEYKIGSLRRLIEGMQLGKPPSQLIDQDGSVVQPAPATPSAPAAPNTPAAGPPPVGPSAQITATPEMIGSPGPGTLESSTRTKTVVNEKLAALAPKIGLMITRGMPRANIAMFMKKNGLEPADYDLDKIIAMRSDPASATSKWIRANPGQPYPIRTEYEVPIEGMEKVGAYISSSAPGAALMSGLDALSAGNLDTVTEAMGADPGTAQTALGVGRAEHPVASLGGSLGGGITAALGGEAALARLGMAPGAIRALLADTTYGGVGGASNADDGNYLAGGTEGALKALTGSLAGQGAMRGLGAAISPTGGNLGQLYASGVRPTPGQRAVNAGDGRGIANVAGRALNATEEALSSVPIVGAGIRGARENARDQFQIGAFNEALKEVGEKLPKDMKPGTAPHDYATKVFNKVYDEARAGLKVAADEELASDLSELSSRVALLAEPSMKRFHRVLEDVVMRQARRGPEMGGEIYKKVQSELGRLVRGIRGSKAGDDELAEALEDLSSALDNGARRHSDPAAVARLDEADRGYAKLVRIRDAAKARGGDSGTFSPTQFDRAIQNNARGRRSEEYLRGEALMQDYAQQGMSLVDRLPNSGSADRIAVGGLAAGGAGYLEPSTLGLLGVLGLAYAPGVRRATTGAMAPRGPRARAIANQVRKGARVAGGVAGTQAALPRD